MQTALMLAAALTLASTCDNTDETPGRSVAPRAVESTVRGPFVNEAVSPYPVETPVPTQASGAAVLHGRNETSSTTPPATTPAIALGTDDDPSDETPAPAPTPTPPTVDTDTMLDGLVGEWTDGPKRSTRSGNGWQVGSCVLTIRSPSSAREVCTNRTRFGDSEPDHCGNVGTIHTRITASAYSLSAEDGRVRFLPGEPELVSDDDCNPSPAGRHTYMLSVDWLGTGDTLTILNTAPGQTTGSPSTYHRTHRR
ncbi:MAG: hypothetical protein Q8Q09_19120 [Deltaproteobacteria bacterium]|nr:hypothetical protein [Deltaproteobacteria bacterium]